MWKLSRFEGNFGMNFGKNKSDYTYTTHQHDQIVDAPSNEAGSSIDYTPSTQASRRSDFSRSGSRDYGGNYKYRNNKGHNYKNNYKNRNRGGSRNGRDDQESLRNWDNPYKYAGRESDFLRSAKDQQDFNSLMNEFYSETPGNKTPDQHIFFTLAHPANDNSASPETERIVKDLTKCLLQTPEHRKTVEQATPRYEAETAYRGYGKGAAHGGSTFGYYNPLVAEAAKQDWFFYPQQEKEVPKNHHPLYDRTSSNVTSVGLGGLPAITSDCNRQGEASTSTKDKCQAALYVTGWNFADYPCDGNN